MILVTGGAGFVGSNFVINWLRGSEEPVVNVDALTYAGNLANLEPLRRDPRHFFVKADICERGAIAALLANHRPRAIVHFAAESHVDRSIEGPGAFLRTNIDGTFALLEAARAYRDLLDPAHRAGFRFLHVSTDEVYGSLGPDDPAFAEDHPYQPNSPYSASKAASDHLVRAWHHTFGLPTLTTNCSNNYGPRQFPEKLIPLMIVNALSGRALPIYGDGLNVRDWLYVDDHCDAIRSVLSRGEPGGTYNIGGRSEMTNRDVVETVCRVLDERTPDAMGPGTRLITYVKDRPGHDRRYAIDSRKIESQIGWRPRESFDSGIRRTVDWYLDNAPWIAAIQDGSYKAVREWSK